MNMKVLITGAGALLGQELFHSLKHSNLVANCFLGFADPSPLAPGLYWADAAHYLPMASDDDYFDSLISLIQQHSYEYLIPVSIFIILICI